jgi:hypothetical protein
LVGGCLSHEVEPRTIPTNYGVGIVADTSVEQALWPAALTALTA